MLKITRSAQETIALGIDFAKRLRGGEVVLLVGDLGAGKTTFVQGVAKALGIKRTVNSPTFVLMKVYEVKSLKLKVQSPKQFRLHRESSTKSGQIQNKAKSKNLEFKQFEIKKLVHIDTYRGLSLADLENIGALEFFGRSDTICFVEWGEGLEKYLQKRRLNYRNILIKNISQDVREFNY